MQDPGAGKFVAFNLARQLQGYHVAVEPEQNSKVQRAAPLAAQAENLFLVLRTADWNKAFIDELCGFPKGAHDDQVDAAAAAYRALCRRSQLAYVAA
jgi:predicted phage terminase large subunit-like protein